MSPRISKYFSEHNYLLVGFAVALIVLLLVPICLPSPFYYVSDPKTKVNSLVSI
jgi:hypothetical protein